MGEAGVYVGLVKSKEWQQKHITKYHTHPGSIFQSPSFLDWEEIRIPKENPQMSRRTCKLQKQGDHRQLHWSDNHNTCAAPSVGFSKWFFRNFQSKLTWSKNITYPLRTWRKHVLSYGIYFINKCNNLSYVKGGEVAWMDGRMYILFYLAVSNLWVIFWPKTYSWFYFGFFFHASSVSAQENVVGRWHATGHIPNVL